MTVGQRIKQYRTAAGLTQTELAESVNISKQTLYKYENDIITNIPSDKIEAIAKITDSTPARLMGWEEDSIATSQQEDPNEEKLINAYRSFNATGKAKLMDYVADLESSPRNYGEVLDSSIDLTEKDEKVSS